VARGLLFSRATGSPVYFVHLSTPLAVDLISEARRGGVHAIAETCPHSPALDDARYAQPDAARYVMTPPLRDRASQAQLWERLSRGAIHSIGSDHCGFSLSQRAGIDDFREISPGIPGVETSLLLMHTFGVVPQRISRSDLVRLLCTAPAKIFCLWPQKGGLQAGSDADIVVFDPNREMTLSAKTLHMRVDYNPYEGRRVIGAADTVLSRGRLVIDNGRFVGRPGRGCFIKRAARS